MATTSFQQINRSCINRSSSKQLFSFSKQKRFQQSKKTLTSQSDYYVPTISEARGKANSFSRSRRQLIFENQQENKKHPSPDIYNVCEKIGHAGISMAIRLKPINFSKQKHPGPATYQSQSLDRINRKIIFQKQKRELKFPLQNQKGKDSPGPYAIQTQRLKNILSNYKNPRQVKIIKKTNIVDLTSFKLKIKAQETLKSKSPVNKTDNIQLPSTFRKSIVLKKQKTVVFDKEIRKSCFDVKDLSPGPASQQIFDNLVNILVNLLQGTSQTFLKIQEAVPKQGQQRILSKEPKLYQLLNENVLQAKLEENNRIMIDKNFFCLIQESSHNHSHPPSTYKPEGSQAMADHPSESRSYTDFPVMDVSVHQIILD